MSEEKFPRVGEPGHISYPYCLLAKTMWPNHPAPAYAWSSIDGICSRIGLQIIVTDEKLAQRQYDKLKNKQARS